MSVKNKKWEMTILGRMIISFCISGLLWLVLKLGNEYTVTAPFDVILIDEPANQIISDNNKTVNSGISTTGFKLLYYYSTPKRDRNVKISLKEAKYKSVDENKFCFSSNYVKDAIANYLSISTNEIEIQEETFNFTMYKLAEKRVAVTPVVEVSFERQYDFYGEPTATPDSITIYGPYNIVKDIEFVNTQTVNLKRVKSNVETETGIFLEDGVYSETETVKVSIDVEKYTEAEVEVPINTLNINNLWLFPSVAKVRYVVAMKDYGNINNFSFKVEIDTSNFQTQELLPLKIAAYPSNTSIVRIIPSSVEYLINH